MHAKNISTIYPNLYKGEEISLEKIDEYSKKQNLLKITEKQTDYEWTRNNKGSL